MTCIENIYEVDQFKYNYFLQFLSILGGIFFRVWLLFAQIFWGATKYLYLHSHEVYLIPNTLFSNFCVICIVFFFVEYYLYAYLLECKTKNSRNSTFLRFLPRTSKCRK